MISEDMGELLNQAHVGISIIQDDKIKFANNRLLAILGFSQKKVLNKSFINFSAKEEEERLKKIKNEVKRLGIPPKTIEFWIVSKDESRKFIRNRYYLLDEGKNKYKLIVFTQDITEDKLKETKVLASEFKKSRFLDFLTEQIIFYDTDMRIIWANKAASDSLGMTPDQTVGKVCYALWYNRDEPCDNCPVIKARETKQENVAEVVTPDERIWHVRGYPVFGDKGSLIGVAELASELTDQRISEMKLEESEEKYRMLFQNSNDIIAVVQIQEDGTIGDFLEVNEVALEKTGYTREEALGKKVDELIENMTTETLMEYYKRVIESPGLTSEKNMITKNGELIPVEIKATMFSFQNQKCVLVNARDITERRETENELKESEDKYKQIFQNTVDAIFIHRVHEDGKFGNFIEFNDLAIQWTGYSREELVNFSSTDINKREIDDGRDIAQELLSEGQTSFETLLMTKDGKSIPVEINSHLFTLRGERVVLSIARDITERRKSEQEIRDSEEKFRQIFHNAHDAIFLSVLNEDNSAGNFVEVNDVVSYWLGYSKEEMFNMKSVEITVPEQREANEEIIKHIIEHEHATFETVLFSRERKRIPVEISSHLFRLKKQRVILSIARNISERIRTQQELLESEEKYRKLVETFPAAIIRSDFEGKITFVNQQAVEVHGYPSTESMLGLSTNVLISEDDEEVAKEIRERCIQDGFVHDIEYSIRRRNGSTAPGEFHAAIIKDTAGAITGYIGVVIDISERKSAEEELRESEEKFRQIFHTAKDAFFIHKITKSGKLGELIEINETACNWLGLPKEQLLDLGKTRLNDTDKIKYAIDISDDLITEDKTTFERVIENPRAEKRPVEFSSHVITLKGEEVLLSIARDITERKKAEETIKASEEKYRALIETSPDAIIMIDLENHLSFANYQAALMFGYDGVEELIGLSPIDFIVREDLEYAYEILNKVINEEGRIRTILTSLKRDGTRFPIQMTSSLIVDADGKPTAIMGVIEDITDRTKAENALRESEEKFRQAFDQSNDGIILHDLKGTVLDVNLRVKEQLGYSKTDFLTLTIQQLHPVTELEASKEAFEEVEKNGSVEFETKFRRKDGSVFPADVSSSMFDIGGKQVVQGVIRDITERKKAEEELVLREEKFRQLFHNANDQIFLTEINEEVGLTGKFIEVNDVACNKLGYSKEELLDMKSIDITASNEKDANPDIIKDIIKDGSKTFETTLVAKNGEFIPTEVSSHVFTLIDKRVVLSISRDISERMKAEKDLRESEERYRKVVETSPDGIILTDLEGKIIVSNLQGVKLYGVDNTEELIGISSFDLIAPEDHDRASYNLQKTIKAGKLSSVEYTFLKKDGSSYPGELSASLILDEEEKPFSIMAIIRDITERKKAEAEIRENEEKYRLLFHNANDIIAIISVPRDGSIGNFIDVNQLTLEKTGYTIEEIQKMSLLDIIKDLSPEQVAIYFQELWDKKYITFERDLIKKNGEFIPIEVNATPFTLQQELTVLITARDITERRRDEALKIMAYTQIEQNIEDFADLVDRIRNPLMSLMGYAELAESMHSKIMIEEAKKIEEITQKISDSYLETEQFRKILREHLLPEITGILEEEEKTNSQ